MTYSIWLEPASKDARYLRKIMQNISEKYNAPMFDPHITLYGEIAKLSTAKKMVRQCKVSQMRLRCTGMGHSENLWKTLFINVKNDKNLKLVYGILQANLEHKYEFKPHISLVYGRLDVKNKKCLARELKIKHSITFDRISIIKSSADVSKWKKQDTIRLKKT